MCRYARWFLVTVVALVPACGSNSWTPSCGELQECVYGGQGIQGEVCRQGCFGNATSCPSGQVCTGASACCGRGVPANECKAPLIMVCCPASGC